MEKSYSQLNCELILEKNYEATEEICSQIRERTAEIINRNSTVNLQTDLQTLFDHSTDQKAIEEELIYIQPMETLDDQKMIVTKLSTIAKLTEMDLKLQLLENYDNFDNQLLIIKLDMIECFIQQTGTRRQKQRMGGLLLTQMILQAIMGDLFAEIEALLWKPAWRRKKARIRLKREI